MERALLRMPGFESIKLFGIRHFSPAGAFHAEQIIEEFRPDCLLVELPSDAQPLLGTLLDPGTVPPVALLSWSNDDSLGISVLPLAGFSPELRAVRSAARLGAEIRFIDLPSGFYLASADDTGVERVVENFDADWEQGFEHGDLESYLEGIWRLSAEASEIKRESGTLNALREGYMRGEMERAAKEGFERILVVAGAYHTVTLARRATLGDNFLNTLPCAGTECALIPYMSGRLGGISHGYSSMLYDCLTRGELTELPERYLSELAGKIRAEGNMCPAGSVIEATRLARSLASIRGKSRPCLTELREAAVCCMGHGDGRNIARAISDVETGLAKGSVGEVSARLPLNADFERRVKALKLTRYLEPEPSEVTLDLRYIEGGAGLALERSAFLHRLRVLGNPFAETRGRDNPPMHMETWILCWSPDVETHLAQSALLGGLIEKAARNALLVRCSVCESLPDTLELIEDAVLCGLTVCLPETLKALRGAVARSVSFEQCARGADKINGLMTRLSVSGRSEPGFPEVLERLRLRAVMLLPVAARCDNISARAVAAGLNLLFDSAETGGERFIRALEALARGGDANPYLSGMAFAMLMERGIIAGNRCEAEIHGRLSTGEEPDRAAGWFEGLVSRNIYALICCEMIWRILDDYIASLDDEEFIRALVILRRAFSGLGDGERAALAGLLENMWNIKSDEYKAYDFSNLNEYALEELL